MNQSSATVEGPRLSLGPVSYFWPRETLLDFYDAVAEWPVDIVYLGEVVCSKRRSFRLEDWLAVGHRLEAAGKTVVLSTLTLIEAASEAGAMRRLCAESPFEVEANDFGAVRVLSHLGFPFVTGPSVNVYNQHALSHLRSLGLTRFVLPVELGGDTLGALKAAEPEVEAEVLAWGRLPLAWSARCYTARAENRPKDQCDLACLADPDGRVMRTREEEPFLVLNGIQTQSVLTQNLAPWIGEVTGTGADVLRVSPQSQGTGEIVAAFDRLRRHGPDDDTLAALADQAPAGCCDGYWHGAAGFERLEAAGHG